MIADSALALRPGRFPFYIVSLPAFTTRSPVPVDGDDWTELESRRPLPRRAFPTPASRSPSTRAIPTTSTPKTSTGRRSPRLLRAGKVLRQDVVYSRTYTRIRRAPSRRHEIALRAHRWRTGRQWPELEEFSPSQETSGNGSGPNACIPRRHHHRLVSVRLQPHAGALRLAVQPRRLRSFNGAGLSAAPFVLNTRPGKTEGHRPY